MLTLHFIGIISILLNHSCLLALGSTCNVDFRHVNQQSSDTTPVTTHRQFPHTTRGKQSPFIIFFPAYITTNHVNLLLLCFKVQQVEPTPQIM